MQLDRSSLGARILDLLIAILWLFLITDAYLQGRSLPELMLDLDLPKAPILPSSCMILMTAISCGLVTFWQRRNIMEDMPVLSSAVDRMFGDGAYNHFTLRLRPACASVISSLILAVVGLQATYATTQDEWSYAVCFGFLAFSLSMFIAYLLSKRFPPSLR